MKWKELTKDAKKWYMKNEKDNPGKFLFRLCLKFRILSFKPAISIC
jgi:hypothetical protein